MELNLLKKHRSQFEFKANPAEYPYLAHDFATWTLTQRQLCDLELLLNGAFTPLSGFLNQADYESVLNQMRLADGTLWPMPITLDITRDFADSIACGEEIALRDAEGLLIAIMRVETIWENNTTNEAVAVFGSDSLEHPGVAYLRNQTHPIYIGGELLKITEPHHYDFSHLRYSPTQLRQVFKERNWDVIVAFQTRNPMHRAHQELTLRAMQQTGAKLLIHPVVGMTKPGDIEYYTRVRCYEQLIKTYPKDTALLSLLPLAMRMGGPREALWHAIIRKNYGCTHFIVGRDHAGPGKMSDGVPFYQPYAAQELALKYAKEIGIHIVPFQEMAYSHKQERYFPLDQFPSNEIPATISGSELREKLQQDLDIPSWFSYPGVIAELHKAYPPKHKQGFTVFFTGLPCSGKSTLANALMLKLRERTNRAVTLLDGDIIRTQLSRGLGFSREDRITNISRIGFVAKEITRHAGITLCALVAPFKTARDQVREMIKEVGGFIEVYVATPLTVCEQRDRKGMYKQAREGVLKQFTGISDPYEAPMSAEIVIDTGSIAPEEGVALIMKQLHQIGYLQ